MINLINHRDEQTAAELLALQMASYQVEADIIGYNDLPPLRENIRDIMESKEIYLGCSKEGRLAGAAAFEIEKVTLTVCKMMVHPQYFNQGIASRLMEAIVEQGRQVMNIAVSTGAANEPAIRLYRKHGFEESGKTVIDDKLTIIHLIKVINT
ncbi:GNAT family N-acetyltransferase [Paenibacillus sambharensis]|uniref:GNAT family N-acetyltransferase n=1 Tax=Paenibacillus sambharensis TaxID=1803190 RepID=A0A2W1LAU2_9BACL|nr:GNAT family N-acetyltransferase [Paenibacillus sambharensis]PZD97368.1 GNAT family N-acetyltransferase [Paenibacillus sambharensis]